MRKWILLAVAAVVGGLTVLIASGFFSSRYAEIEIGPWPNGVDPGSAEERRADVARQVRRALERGEEPGIWTVGEHADTLVIKLDDCNEKRLRFVAGIPDPAEPREPTIIIPSGPPGGVAPGPDGRKMLRVAGYQRIRCEPQK